MTEKQRNMGLGLAVFCTAFFLRLLYLWLIRDDPYFSTLVIDALSYHQKALAIADGQWIAARAFYQDPLYPYFLALIYLVAGPGIGPVLWVQALLGGLSAVLIYAMGSFLGGRRVGLVAAALYISCGLLYFYDGLLGKEALGFFLICLFVLALFWASEKETAVSWLLTGLALGAGALTRANLLLMAPVFGLWILVFSSSPLKKRAVMILVFWAGTFLALSPATIHNYLASKDLVLVTSQAGTNFYYGNGPKSKGMFENPDRVRLVPRFEEEDFLQEALLQTKKASMKPSEVSAFWMKEGLDYIRDNPFRTLGLWAEKAAMLVSYFEIPDNYYFAFARTRAHMLRAALVGFGLLFCLGLAGLAALWPDRRRFVLPLLFVATYAASLVPFHMASRYRLPLVPLFLVLSAACLAAVWDGVKERQWGRLSVMAVLAVAGALLTFWPYDFVPADVPKTFDQPLNSLGSAAAQRGEHNLARDLYTKALDKNPGNATARYNLAISLVELGEAGKAALELERVTAMDPHHVWAWENLAMLRLVTGEPASALAILEEALLLNPRSADLYAARGLTLFYLDLTSESVKDFWKALELNPRLASAHYNLACVLARAGETGRAWERLEKAAALDPAYITRAVDDPDLSALGTGGEIKDRLSRKP